MARSLRPRDHNVNFLLNDYPPFSFLMALPSTPAGSCLRSSALRGVVHRRQFVDRSLHPLIARLELKR